MKTWFVGICIVGVVAMLLGCEANPSEECGGLGDVVSCLSVTNVSPIDSTGNPSFNVDAVGNVCVDETGVRIADEPFTDHNADITFENSQFTTASDSFAVTLRSYSVSYILTNCPEQASGCPSLSGFEGQRTIVIPVGGQVSDTFPFVPLDIKAEYVAEGGEVFGNAAGAPFPSYSAQYVFTATTEPFSSDIQVVVNRDFTIGNFNNCP